MGVRVPPLASFFVSRRPGPDPAKRYRRWAFFFIVIGLNPLTIYVLQSIFDFGCIARIFVEGIVNHLELYRDVVWLASVFAVKWLLLYFLFRKKIFLKV
ncbi:MAG TPA: hypothetical protein P5568_01375 [Acidobacteriota bacterium]|nr:hypothetical protein [Acidobacteriota bacterium]